MPFVEISLTSTFRLSKMTLWFASNTFFSSSRKYIRKTFKSIINKLRPNTYSGLC